MAKKNAHFLQWPTYGVSIASFSDSDSTITLTSNTVLDIYHALSYILECMKYLFISWAIFLHNLYVSVRFSIVGGFFLVSSWNASAVYSPKDSNMWIWLYMAKLSHDLVTLYEFSIQMSIAARHHTYNATFCCTNRIHSFRLVTVSTCWVLTHLYLCFLRLVYGLFIYVLCEEKNYCVRSSTIRCLSLSSYFTFQYFWK